MLSTIARRDLNQLRKMLYHLDHSQLDKEVEQLEVLFARLLDILIIEAGGKLP